MPRGFFLTLGKRLILQSFESFGAIRQHRPRPIVAVPQHSAVEDSPHCGEFSTVQLSASIEEIICFSSSAERSLPSR